jgi:hypothetical protein
LDEATVESLTHLAREHVLRSLSPVSIPSPEPTIVPVLPPSVERSIDPVDPVVEPLYAAIPTKETLV